MSFADRDYYQKEVDRKTMAREVVQQNLEKLKEKRNKVACAWWFVVGFLVGNGIHLMLGAWGNG